MKFRQLKIALANIKVQKENTLKEINVLISDIGYHQERLKDKERRLLELSEEEKEIKHFLKEKE